MRGPGDTNVKELQNDSIMRKNLKERICINCALDLLTLISPDTVASSVKKIDINPSSTLYNALGLFGLP